MSDIIKINDTVYVKKDYLTTPFFELGHAIKYKLHGNTAKVLHAEHDVKNDVLKITAKMLYDNKIYTFPSYAVSKDIMDRIC